MNNFISQESCLNSCNEFNPCLNGEPLSNSLAERIQCRAEDQESACPSPTRYYCHVGSSESTTVCCPRTKGPSVCELGKNYGVGSDSLTRWYYNLMSGECESFQYYGVRSYHSRIFSSISLLRMILRHGGMKITLWSADGASRHV